MEKEEKTKKVKDAILNFIQVLSIIQWLISVIGGPGITIIVVVILMPEINLLWSIMLGVLLTIVIAIFMMLANIAKLKKEEITKTKDIEEQRRKDEREPPKELLKTRLNNFITYWEEDKESILENDQKRKKELKKKLFKLGNELKKKVEEKEDLLSPLVLRKAEDIANDITNFSSKITSRVSVVNENVERTKRINQKLIEEGDKLIERAKEIIKILGEENE